jgi:hypothetical protein
MFVWSGCESPISYLKFQDSTTTMKGILLFNYHLLLTIIGVVFLVGWLLTIILKNFTKKKHKICQFSIKLKMFPTSGAFFITFNCCRILACYMRLGDRKVLLICNPTALGFVLRGPALFFKLF